MTDLHGLHDWARDAGDAEASRLANEWFMVQEIILTRDGLGQVLNHGPHSLCAVFDKPSDALNRALEIQRVLEAPAAEPLPPSSSPAKPVPGGPQVRIGLHLGEVLFRQGARVEVISQHLLRAQRMMEAAGPGQIYASEAVVEAGRDFIDVPAAALAVRNYGEYYLPDAGPSRICEVADLRFTQPQPPSMPDQLKTEAALTGRLENAGYQDLERLGESVHGVTYQATHRESGQPVVIKVLAPAWVQRAPARQRLREALARVHATSNSGVARLREERLDTTPAFLVFDRVDALPLTDALATADTARIARVFHAVCRVLVPLHAAGVVHGNLKPGNVLVRADGTPVLTDWGMADAEPAAAGAQGDPTALACVAPERLAGEEARAASDVYALGALLFRVLTGSVPFGGATVHDVVQAQLHDDPPLPSAANPAVPDPLQRICLKALEKNPTERYAGTAVMAADLNRFLAGGLVRTRPTVYDNLLFHRVQKHVRQVREWFGRGLLNEEESHRLLAAYDGLQRRGIPAVMESRVYRLWQTLVYVGGWAVVNGALLWLVLHWQTLERVPKLMLGSVPAVTAFALAWAMTVRERFRLTFLALVVGIVAVPLLAGVWLYEFKVGALVPHAALGQELFYSLERPDGVTNLQLFLAALATFVVAACVMLYTRTATHSAQALAAFAFLYSTELLFFDLKAHWTAEQWATLSLQYAPLWLACVGVVIWLLREPDRPHQAAPWILFAAVLAIVITGVLALHGLREWTAWSESIRRPAGYLLLSVAGVLQTALGLRTRTLVQHRGRLAVLLLVLAGLVSVLGGLALAGLAENWPASWWSPRVFGQAVPAAHLALPLASLGIALLACRFQMFTFLGLGLAGFAASVHLLGDLYFQKNPIWPQCIMIAGGGCFFAALWQELKRSRGNAAGDDYQRL